MAVKYADYVAASRCQRALYFDSGGQPGHRAAWLDPEVNRRSNGFFEKTLTVLDRAWVRPRFNRYLEFQHRASTWCTITCARAMHPRATMAALNNLMRGMNESEAQ